LIEEAVLAGVVKKVELKAPKNPNKWGKTLAPWFTEECREAKKAVYEAKKVHGRGSDEAVAAAKAYRQACVQGRQQFSRALPDMLKYRPK
jgi:hypothetical protein